MKLYNLLMILFQWIRSFIEGITSLFLKKEGMVNLSTINRYLDLTDWEVFENANASFSLQGLNHHIVQSLIAQFWLKKIYPKIVSDAHRSGALYLHDLGSLSSYCFGWDLYDLLLKGFGGVEGKPESLPPKHLRSALAQVWNFFFTLQGEAAGALAFSNFDTYLAPFIHYDKLSYSEIKQCLQEFIFNMNVPTRVGFQCPFSNITLDLVAPEHIAKQPVIIGGEPQKETYREFSKEMEMFNIAFCEVMMEGDKKGQIFTFPIPTYNITKDFNWESSATKAIFEMTSKFGIPYFASFIHSDLKPEDTRSLCCRLRLDMRFIRKGGLFCSNPLTGSLGVVTLNLPHIYYAQKKSLDIFYREIEKYLEIARLSLQIKRREVEKFCEIGLYPYSRVFLEAVKKKTGKYFSNHFSTIGVIGMHEMLVSYGISEGIVYEEGKKIALEVLSFIQRKLDSFRKEDKVLYNLEASPAEGASYRLAKGDKKRWGGIETSGENEPFYTNSTQLPVDATNNVFESLDHQDKLQSTYTGGTVLHCFLGERIDADVCKNLVKKITEKYHLPYFTITPTFSICSTHGYLEGEQPECPTCKKPTLIYSRVTGYYRPVSAWNMGKKEEFERRKEFKI